MNSLRELSIGKYQWIDRAQAHDMQKLIVQNLGRLQIEYAGVMVPNDPVEVDFKKLLMARIRTLAAKPKKAKLKRDIGQFFLKLSTNEEKECSVQEWKLKCKEFGGKIDNRLYEQIASEWMDKKTGSVLLFEMAAYYLTLYPTKRSSALKRTEKLKT